MDQSTVKRLMESYANPFFIDHEDVTKCGTCWKATIGKEVAQSYLDAGKTEPSNIEEMFNEIEQKWRETSLYKRVQALRAEGRELVEIGRLLELEGIEI